MENAHSNGKKLSLSALGIFVVLGLTESSWAPMVPFIKERFGLSEGALGMLLLCTGIGSFCSLPLVKLCIDRLGVRRTAAASLLLMGLTLVLISLNPWLWAAAALLLGFGAMTIGLDVSANVNAVLVEEKLSRHLMSGFHAGYSAGTLAGSALMSLMLAAGLWLGASAAAMALTGVVLGLYFLPHLFVSGNHAANASAESADGNATAAAAKSGRMPLAISLIGIMCFIMYCIEGSVMGWSGVLAREEYGVDLNYSGFTYVAFAVSMTIVRFAGNRATDRFGRRRVVVAGSLCVAAGLILSVSTSALPGLLAGFFIVGAGAANIVPQLVSYTGEFRSIDIPKAITFINAFGYSGILAGPVVIGHLAEFFGLRAVFAGMGVLALSTTALSLKVIRK